MGRVEQHVIEDEKRDQHIIPPDPPTLLGIGWPNRSTLRAKAEEKSSLVILALLIAVSLVLALPRCIQLLVSALV